MILVLSKPSTLMIRSGSFPPLLLFISAIFLIFHGGSYAQPPPTAIDSFFSVRYPNQINGNLLLAEKGSVVYQKSFGQASFASGLPNTASTLFNLASISKVITSTAVLQLAERKKLKLADEVQKYLPGFPFPAIQIRHLLTHTSGLPNLELYEDIVARFPDSIIDNSAIIPALQAWKKPLPFAPGDKWQYCNTNYDLLALIIEKVSGLPYPAYLDKNIFRRAAMNESFVLVESRSNKMAIAHVLPNWYSMHYIPADSVARYRYINYNLRGLVGSTNIVSTTMDMLRFDKSIFSGKLLKKETLDIAHTPVQLNDGTTFQEGSMDMMLGEGKGSYGMGWSIYEQPGLGKSVGHSGFNYGLATFYFHHIHPDQTIVAFDNTAGPAFGRAATSALYLLNNRAGIEKVNKTSLARVLGSTMKEKGIDDAVVIFNDLKADTSRYYINEREINWLGYDFLRADFEGHERLALEVFKINTLLYPNSFNVYDSYGEALLKSGKKEQAILMYKKSLSIKPDNQGAIEALSKLKM